LPEIDCLISDIDMPGVDGFALLRELRTVRPGLPVILITGHAEMLTQPLPIDPSQYPLFKKPFDGNELLAAVGNALRRPGA
jgi:DNA-binding NtrC family response regulator